MKLNVIQEMQYGVSKCDTLKFCVCCIIVSQCSVQKPLKNISHLHALFIRKQNISG